ncbi:TPA: polysaccharide biosynthesis tyrosine autokinase [Klebsiella quasipneumoniae subsp. quasipneumoniae]|uniref:polysaccharide biosynthesis tyrosine autokinase n=1 Tax=Klebsiella quasipneumoniae TaxID=1463165 RepID=UPI000651583B|nr:polysaccharide biosynthesis tyrosine autokinase [Klebsiella quasipneumoniae]KMH47854.1 protein-tyrosine kinase [Klebsiella quasipneumoniae]HBR1319112.1 polysaccharide biosynthesis tyrosine autokinase [Klebsiella quasipneumoniae subsp. quasipneumoniae]
MAPMIKKSAEKNLDEIDLGRLLGEVIDHRKFIIAGTSFFIFLGLIYAVFSTPIYQADSLIQVEQKQGNAILSSLTDMLPDSQPKSAPEIALLQSRMILGKTVDELKLQIKVEQVHFPIFGKGWSRLLGQKEGNIEISRLQINNDSDDIPEVKISIKNKNSYFVEGDSFKYEGRVGELLSKKEITLKLDRIDADPNTTFSVLLYPKLQVISDLLDSFSVSDQGKDTGILSLSLTGDNAEKISEILTNISENYLAQNISRQSAQDAKSLEFLNEQIPIIRSELDQAENKLNEYRKKSDSVDLSLEAKSVLEQVVNVDNQLNNLTFRESEISQLYTKEHPTYKALLEKRKTLEDEKTKLNRRVADMPETQQEILRLSRDVESGRAIYMQLLNRQQELSISKSSVIGNVRIIDHAVTEPKPIRPKKVVAIGASLIIGLIISFAIIILKVLLRRGLESPEQLEELGVNVYASIPVAESFNSKSSNSLFAKRKPDNDSEIFLSISNPADIAIEAIRGLRTSLHFAMLEARNNILMISGASPNAGKTFVSSNLAAMVSQTGKRVLFIDTDMRKGYTHKLFNINNENGLSDYLSGKVDLNTIINKLQSVSLDCITRGMSPPNPAELLMHPRFNSLLEWASKEYDLVILDTPPILAVTDSAIIGSYAGTVLLVARFELNTAKEIQAGIKRFENAGVAIKGCILNAIVKKASAYYTYGYNYYGYKYKDN